MSPVSVPPAGGVNPSFGDNHFSGMGRESRAQTLQKGEWPAEGATSPPNTFMCIMDVYRSSWIECRCFRPSVISLPRVSFKKNFDYWVNVEVKAFFISDLPSSAHSD